jgi:hypothetical protein
VSPFREERSGAVAVNSSRTESILEMAGLGAGAWLGGVCVIAIVVSA